MKISKIYLDMDGVLADFDRGVKELCGLAPHGQVGNTDKDDEMMWEAIKNVGHFYDKLELLPGALEMYKELSSRYDVEILSAIPKPSRGIESAGDDKISWAHRLLSPELKVNIVYRRDKKDYVTGPDCILIDDLEKNINEWNECGGTGIRFVSAENTLVEMSRIVQM